MIKPRELEELITEGEQLLASHWSRMHPADTFAARAGLALLRVARDQNPACERCGCTELNACPGGCSWDPGFASKNRAVCSRCATQVRRQDARRRATTLKRKKASA